MLSLYFDQFFGFWTMIILLFTWIKVKRLQSVKYKLSLVLVNNGLQRPCTLLPAANEVWGKVIFLHLSVILFTGGSTWAGTPPRQVHPNPRQVHPLGRYPSGRYTPLVGTPPRQVPLWAGTPSPGRYTPWQVPLPLGRYTPPDRYTPLV